MATTYIEIEDMILEHIKEINVRIPYTIDSSRAELYKAKSLALQSLVDLKNGKDGK